jgi:pimeloyl-ACP methyl ester carboxylesterase
MIERGFVSTPGQVHYRKGGSGSALLLLHQTAESSRAYQAVLPLLAQQHTVIATDTPGYGDSRVPDHPPSVSDYAAVNMAVLDSLGIEQAAVMGIHTGASIAIEIAAAYPQRTLALVAVGVPLWDAQERHERKQAAQSWQPTEFKEDGSHLIEKWQQLRRIAPNVSLEVVHRAVIDNLKAHTPTAAYRALHEYPIEERLPLVRCPALILAGERDSLAKHTEPAAALMARVQWRILPDQAGFLPDTMPLELVQLVEDFLDGSTT